MAVQPSLSDQVANPEDRFSHDAFLLSLYSRDTTVKVWDEATLAELRSLGGHTGSVTDVILLSPKQYGSLGKYSRRNKVCI